MGTITGLSKISPLYIAKYSGAQHMPIWQYDIGHNDVRMIFTVLGAYPNGEEVDLERPFREAAIKSGVIGNVITDIFPGVFHNFAAHIEVVGESVDELESVVSKFKSSKVELAKWMYELLSIGDRVYLPTSNLGRNEALPSPKGPLG
ncbi:MAG TPA: hypothetical protein VFR09_03990 [Alphaproteobacteria bacterium]|nr:hypothetical protein [Alphaproteobacteria bacterium]